MSAGVIGREDELAAVRAFATSLRGGSALLIEGEAGIGKTTLWRAGVEMARGHELRVLAATPSAAESGLSFAAVGDLLEPVLDTVLPRLPAPQRHALEFALLLAEARGAVPDQRAVAVALLGALRALAGRGGVLVAVDDVQWLDPASAAALAFALRRVRDQPVAFLLAERAGERSPLDAGVARLAVGPLGIGAIHGLLRERLGVGLPRPTLRRLHEVSGGNPSYALELARALEPAGAGVEPLVVPPTLLELVAQRLEALPRETREALQIAAALSQPTVGVLARAAPGSGRALDVAVQARVIEVDEGRIRFAHPLLAAGAYAAVPPGRRLELHARLAELVVVGGPCPSSGAGRDRTGCGRRRRARAGGAAGAGARRAGDRGRAGRDGAQAHAARRPRRGAAPCPRRRPLSLRGRRHGRSPATARGCLAVGAAWPARAAVRAMLGRVHLYEGEEERAAEVFQAVLRRRPATSR